MSTPSRFRTGLLLLTLTAMVVGGSASTANAQTRVEAEAAAVFRRGAEAMQAGRVDEAILLFLESYRAVPSPNAIYNVALAHRSLHHTRLAVEFFERYIEEAGDEIPAGRLVAVQRLLGELREQLSVIRPRVQPPEAVITVDTVRVWPRRGEILLDPGERVLEFQADGFRTERVVRTLHEGDRITLELNLVREAERPTPVAPSRVDRTSATALAPDVSAAVPAVTPHPAARSETTTTPIYARWWFWTGIAVLVGGGVTAAVLLHDDTVSDRYPASVQINTITVH
jgi:hypothetical protein